nr:RNA-directed DNA polymerase, eukaryota [Tanacetum cinerariifolium]
RILSLIEDLEKLLSRKSQSEPSLLFDLEEDEMIGQARPQGPIPDLCSMEKLLQAPTDGVGDAIVVPLILANQFELKIGGFAKGCNSSFVALIPKVLNPKVVSDYRHISLIESLYKVITKILDTRISLVMSDLISDVQTAFLPSRQILDGPFIVNEILSRCIKIDSSLTLSHLFYANDVVFIGEWSNSNLIGIMNILRCFSFLSGMSINIHKSLLLGIGVSDVSVFEAANRIGCSVMKAPFRYLGIMVGVGGRLTLLKAVLGSTPIYNMSLFKVPKQVLNSMERMRMNFFNGVQDGERKIAWVKWSKVLASKKFGRLGVSSFFALNRVLIFKW